MLGFRILRGLVFFGLLASVGILAGNLFLSAAHGHHLGLFFLGLFGLFAVSRAVRFVLWRRYGHAYGCAGGCGYAGRRRDAVTL